jgi:hypothetical protein
MITKRKLDIYKHYRGDIDMFCRTSSETNQKLFGPSEWTEIEDYIQNLRLIESGAVSPEFKEKALDAIAKNVDTHAIKALQNIARKWSY